MMQNYAAPVAPQPYFTGQYVSGGVYPVTQSVTQHQKVIIAQPQPIIEYAEPVVQYTPPQKTIVQREIVVEPAPIIRKERIIVKSECPVGTTKTADGSCLQETVKVISKPAPIVSVPAPEVSYHPAPAPLYVPQPKAEPILPLPTKRRSAVYCYGDGKHYDGKGRLIKNTNHSHHCSAG